MSIGQFTLFDIVTQKEGVSFQICVITLDVKEPLNHTLTLNYLPINDETSDYCKRHNDKQVNILCQSIDEVKTLLQNNPYSTKRKAQLEYLSNTLDHYVNWYKNQELEFPDLNRYNQQVERKPKYQEYEELFNDFLSDPNSNPDEVKNVLNDKPRWKNPSQYLKNARRKAEFSVSQLKAHPGFNWIDPKNTAID